MDDCGGTTSGWAELVKATAADGSLQETLTQENLTDTVPKRAILVPAPLFPSAMLSKLCDLTGQRQEQARFGVDEETPSGVSMLEAGAVAANSTQLSGVPAPSLNLNLSEITGETDQIAEDGGLDVAGAVDDREESRMNDSIDWDIMSRRDGLEDTTVETVDLQQRFRQLCQLDQDSNSEQQTMTVLT